MAIKFKLLFIEENVIMGEISNKIDTIVTSRKNKVNVLQNQKADISSIFENVNSFKMLQERIKNDPGQYAVLQGNGDVIGNLLNISTDSFLELYSKYIRELNRLIERFGRDSLNICFVGSAGHGKSLVMQKISGLSSNVIPSADGSDCTGTKSIISNVDTLSVTADITFFNHTEIIKIVNKYLDKITQRTASKIAVSNVEEIRMLSSKMDYLDSIVEGDEEAGFFEHLKKYIQHFDEYYSSLGTSIEVHENDIEQYVAQYKSDDINVKYYRYLSVKNANIKCHFPYDDVGKIVLVDTIGIGATSMGVEEDMLDAIENDSDAIIYMFRPEPLRSRLDSNTLTTWGKISKRITAEYMKEMLFVVLNKVSSGKGENIKNIPELMKTFSNPKFNYAKLLAVDCSSDTEVRENLIIPVLTQLAERIQIVDQRLIDKLNDIGAHLREAYNEICLQTEKAFVNSANEDMKRYFNDDIENTYNTMLDKLRDCYIHKYNDLRQSPCMPLQNECQQKLKNILISVPSKEYIINLLNRGTINQHDAYKIGTEILRMKIIDDFTSLNIILSKIIEDMKKEVIGILANIGLLNRICAFDANVSSSEWINDFLSKTEAKNKYPLIYSALKTFEDYTINVQGFIIHEVRDRLDTIDLALVKNTPSINYGLTDKDSAAEEIVDMLKDRAFDIKSKLTRAFSEIYKVPNKSMFAAITDLCDRLSYSKQGSNHNVTREWRYLYEDWMRQIWTEKYDQQSGMQQIAGEWNNTIHNLKIMNKLEYFSIK